MAPSIRRARPGDAGTIAAFNVALAKETEDVVLDPAVIGPGVRAVLEDPARGLYWVAEVEGRVVGQTMVTWEWSDWRNGFLWWIQSVYVAPGARAKGVFKALHGQIADEARKAGAVGIRLYVFDRNARAREVYARLGMKDGHYRVLEQMFGEGHE
jgi:GNAT superfamily N-acetyltransferase